MGRTKPIDLIVMEGKSHRTKEEIRIRRENEIRPDADNVECPEWLCELGREEWNRIEDDLLGLGLLTNLDISQLAIYCDAYAKYVKATNEIDKYGLVIKHTNKAGATNIVTNPYVQIASKYADLVKKFCDEFGLSPSSRARMALPKKSEPTNEKEEKYRGLI
jgi:P27 family predicted phage terminase small subunit